MTMTESELDRLNEVMTDHDVIEHLDADHYELPRRYGAVMRRQAHDDDHRTDEGIRHPHTHEPPPQPIHPMSMSIDIPFDDVDPAVLDLLFPTILYNHRGPLFFPRGPLFFPTQPNRPERGCEVSKFPTSQTVTVQSPVSLFVRPSVKNPDTIVVGIEAADKRKRAVLVRVMGDGTVRVRTLDGNPREASSHAETQQVIDLDFDDLTDDLA